MSNQLNAFDSGMWASVATGMGLSLGSELQPVLYKSDTAFINDWLHRSVSHKKQPLPCDAVIPSAPTGSNSTVGD